MHACVRHEKYVGVWMRRGVMVEGWKAMRKEWKKQRRKKGKKGKSGFGKSPFCFCLAVSLPLPFFPPHPSHHHTKHVRTHPSHTIQHDALVHTITCKQDCVLCRLFGEWTVRHTRHHPHPTLHHLTPHNTHQRTQNRHSSWRKQQ